MCCEVKAEKVGTVHALAIIYVTNNSISKLSYFSIPSTHRCGLAALGWCNMLKYKVNNANPIGTGGEGKVLEVTKVGHGEGEVLVMKQRMCFSLEDANLALSEVK